MGGLPFQIRFQSRAPSTNCKDRDKRTPPVDDRREESPTELLTGELLRDQRGVRLIEFDLDPVDLEACKAHGEDRRGDELWARFGPVRASPERFLAVSGGKTKAASETPKPA